MNDRELLEAAAKAAGIQIDYTDKYGGSRYSSGFDMAGNAVLDWHNNITWNPLTDDGDALRLAVKLRIDVTHFGSSVRTIARNTEGVVVDVCEVGQVTGAEGVRRVIVMAAAAIGAAS